MQLRAGDTVEVRRRNRNRTWWKPGKVVEVRGNKVVNVQLDHKGHPVTVKMKDVRVPKNAKPLTQSLKNPVAKAFGEYTLDVVEQTMLNLQPPYHINTVYNALPEKLGISFAKFKLAWDSLMQSGDIISEGNDRYRHKIHKELIPPTAPESEPKTRMTESSTAPSNYKRLDLKKMCHLLESSVVIYKKYSVSDVRMRAAVLINFGGELSFRSLAKYDFKASKWIPVNMRKHVDPTNFKVIAVMPPLTENNGLYHPEIRTILEDEYLRIKEEYEREHVSATLKDNVKSLVKAIDKKPNLDPALIAKITELIENS